MHEDLIKISSETEYLTDIIEKKKSKAGII
jgi:hypothetical protein